VRSAFAYRGLNGDFGHVFRHRAFPVARFEISLRTRGSRAL